MKTTLNKPATIEILNTWIEEMSEVESNHYFLSFSNMYNIDTELWEIAELLTMNEDTVDMNRIVFNYGFETFTEFKEFFNRIIKINKSNIINEIEKNEDRRFNYNTFSNLIDRLNDMTSQEYDRFLLEYSIEFENKTINNMVKINNLENNEDLNEDIIKLINESNFDNIYDYKDFINDTINDNKEALLDSITA